MKLKQNNKTNTSKMKRKMILFILAIMVLLGGITGISYGYWNSLQTNHDYIIQPGDGIVLSLSVNNEGNKHLVPSGQVNDTNDTDTITLVYDFGIDDTTTNGVTVSASFTQNHDYFDINNAETYSSGLSGIFEVTTNWDTTSIPDNSSTATLTITITLNEPDNQTTYDSLQALNTSDLTLTIVVNGSPN